MTMKQAGDEATRRWFVDTHPNECMQADRIGYVSRRRGPPRFRVGWMKSDGEVRQMGASNESWEAAFAMADKVMS